MSENAVAVFDRVCTAVERVIRGKRHAVELAVTTLVAGGHLLLEDVPGVGKTSLAKALAAATGATLGRIQFTPDLLPTDVVGSSIWNPRDGRFEYHPGPVFAQVVLADEINRASPKTQSALLEAMAEAQVTADGETRPLPEGHMVIATQNPAEQHGTFPLPESQLDRFLLRLSLGYPDRTHESEILDADGTESQIAHIDVAADRATIAALRRHCAQIHVAPALTNYLLDLAHASRSHPHLALGASPRAVLGLRRVAQIRAMAAGRNHVLPDDVKATAVPALAHRLVLSQGALLAGSDSASVIDELLHEVAVPRHGRRVVHAAAP
jgi:MoxR-like ATPase